MSFAKCFDAVSMVTREASDRFKPLWRVNRNAEVNLEDSCKLIDLLSNELNGVAFEVYVDEITTDITISLICKEVIIENSNYNLYS